MRSVFVNGAFYSFPLETVVAQERSVEGLACHSQPRSLSPLDLPACHGADSWEWAAFLGQGMNTGLTS